MSDSKKVADQREALKSQLDAETYRIVCDCGTEPPFTGKYWDCKTPGTYHCVVCDQALFDSQTKYDSGSGWPSYYQPVANNAVSERNDDSLGMRRIEILCANCDAHLGHVFPDGPPPTGLRYCINSAALNLRAR